VRIDETDNGREEYRKCFTTTGGCVYQPAFAIYNRLPALFLEREGAMSFGSQPFADVFISTGMVDGHDRKAAIWFPS
jgi:hypothetical protein